VNPLSLVSACSHAQLIVVNRAFGLALRITALGAAFAMASGQSAARAHAIESSLERLSGLTNTLRLESRFGNGEPASNAAVRLVPPSGGTGIEIGYTDARGQLRFQLPGAAGGDWELQVDRGPGHRDYLELPARGPAQVSSTQRGSFPGGLSIQGLLAGAQPLALAGLTLMAGCGGWRWSRRQRR
jgi:nickel transport protein